jgi:hypothetical protein
MTGQHPRIYNTRRIYDITQSFITCYFKIAYTTHTRTYEISSQFTLSQLYEIMSSRIRNDLYLELSEINDFVFVIAGQNTQEEGEYLVPSNFTTLRDITETDHISFYIRPVNNNENQNT